MSSGIHNKHTGYHHRRSIRLPGYDYSSPGYYFVTLCIYDRTKRFFCDVISGQVVLNEFGSIVQNEFIRTEQIRPNVKIDEYVVMPNHCHIIYHICPRRGTLQRAPTDQSQYDHTIEQRCIPMDTQHRIPSKCKQIERFGKPTSNTIPTIVRLTKSTITKQINIIRNRPGDNVWQCNYYEHIIRDYTSLCRIRKYIRRNPHHWEHNPENHINTEIEKFDMVEITEC